jgi:hypothetical protein
MKKKNKILSTLLFGSLIAPCIFMMSACAETPLEHKAVTEWSTDETYHWHACTVEDCEHTYDKEEHDYENYVCKVCNDIDEAVVAVVGNGENRVFYATLAEAIAGANENDTIELLKDLDFTKENNMVDVEEYSTKRTGDKYVASIEKTLTLDFGGHKVTSEDRCFYVAGENVVLTLKNGKVESQARAVHATNSSKVVIESDFEIDANKARSASCCGVQVVFKASVEISGKVSAPNLAVCGNGTKGRGEVSITINEGAEINCEYIPATSGNNYDNAGIYMPNSGTLTINGGTITGGTAVYVKCGTVKIADGSFNAIAPKVAYGSSTNGGKTTGSAIIIDTTTGKDYKGGNPTFTISGGRFTVLGENSQIEYYHLADTTQYFATINNLTNFTIKEFTYDASTETVAEHKTAKTWSNDATNHWHACEVASCENETHIQDKAEHTYTTYEYNETQHWQKCDVCQYETAKANHTYNEKINNGKVCTTCGYINGEATIGTGETMAVYSTLQEAIEGANENETIVLLKNISTDTVVTVSKTLTIDGQNKYSITASDNFSGSYKLISVPSDGKADNRVVLTLKNVTIDANNKGRAVVVQGEGLIVDGATITGGYAKAGDTGADSYIAGVFMTGKSTFKMTSGNITGNTDNMTDYTQYARDLWMGSEVVAEISGGTIGRLFVNSNSSASPSAQTTITGGNITNVYVEYDTNCAAKLVYEGGTIETLLLSTTTTETYQTITNPTTGTYIGGQGTVDSQEDNAN